MGVDMFICENNEQYEQLINGMKKIVAENKCLINSKEYKLGRSVYEKKDEIKKSGLKAVLEIIFNRAKFKKGAKYSMSNPLIDKRNYGPSNYFSSEKIAVYTCITGNYDKVIDPLFVPDNCDYYAITDFELPKGSLWKRIDIDNLNISELQTIKSQPNLLNRYFKMFPNKIFKDYKYSVYVDGNIRICTDLTEYVNRISEFGISTFRHAQRSCVYEEAKACVAMGKETASNIDNYINHLRQFGMPKNYGMAQCSLIVREHNTDLCKTLMQDWWSEYFQYAKRDQLSFPFVMFKHNIKMDRITTLGSNLYQSNSFEVIKHK